MSLSCSCSDDYEWYFHPAEDYSTLTFETMCSSCRARIRPGDTVLFFETFEYDENGEEQYGDDLTTCEVCSDLFLSLYELGFCISPDENQKHLLAEYVQMRDSGGFQ